MKNTFCFLILIGIYFLNACSDTSLEETLLKTEIEKEFLLEKEEKAIALVKNFQYNENSTLRSSGLDDDVTIISIESKTYPVDDVNNISVRSSKLTSEDESTFDLYTIIFEKRGEKGFSIVSPDERLDFVYAYSENGSISDTTFNVGLAITLEGIPEVAKQQLKNANEVSTRASTTYQYMSVSPLINTQWSQSYPYNMHSPATSGCAAGVAPAGCTVIALAQAIAYLRLPGFSANGQYDFAAMTATATFAKASVPYQICSLKY